MTTTISLDALRELAAFRTARGCAISLFLDLNPSSAPTAADVAARVRSLLSQGQRQLRKDLGAEQREGMRADLDRLERFFEAEFDRDGAAGYAVFTSRPDDVWQTLALAGRVPDQIRIDTEFHLAPLVPLLGRGEGALVVAVNRERGSLYRLNEGRLVELADLSDEAPRRHDQGGWAQARMQRHVDNLALEHYRDVADELERRFRRLGRPRVVVVATDDTRADFEDALSSEVADAVIGWAAAEAHASRAKLEQVVGPVLDRWLAEREAEEVERWREEAGRAARASAGWAETLEAASDGRVELLLYAEGVRHDAVRCPRCGRVQAEGDSCPLDGASLERSPDGLDLAVRQTLAHGGAVWAVRHREDLGPVGGVGAILRY
jgi:peptide chain release factor subunit 1